MRPEIDDLYDAFEHPRAERPSLPLLSPAESTAYIDLVRRKVLDTLESCGSTAPALLPRRFVFGMVLQHEHQHDETMLATHQLRRGRRCPLGHPPPVPPRAVTAAEVLVPADRS